MARAAEVAAIEWLAASGFDVPRVIRTGADGWLGDAPDFGPPWIVKPDVAIGGKGLMGVVRKAHSRSELIEAMGAVQSLASVGIAPVALALEEYVEGTEIYLSVAVDESRRAAMMRVAGAAGVGFDAARAAHSVLDLDDEIHLEQLSSLLDRASIHDSDLRSAVIPLIERLWRVFRETEALLIEFNPIRWDGSRAVPVGFACEFDDNAHAEARARWPATDLGESGGRPQTERERRVAAADAAQPRLPMVRFLELQGDVALLVVGGGASLLCFDRLVERGVTPACYADYSPGAGSEKLKAVVEAGLTVPGIKGAIFGAVVVSLADVVELARGLVDGIRAAGVDATTTPIVARIAGPNEAAARELLETVPGLIAIGREQSLEEACDRLLRELDRPSGPVP